MNIGFVWAGPTGQKPHLRSCENATHVDTKLASFGHFSRATARRRGGPRTVRTSRCEVGQAEGADPPECHCRPQPTMGPTPHVLLLCSLPSDTDREIRASFDRQGRATRPVVDPRVSFRSAFLKAFRPLSRPTGEASRHGSGSPVSIEWRSSPARLITSIIAGRHEPAWGRSLAVAYSPWLWRASVSSDRSTFGRSWSSQLGRIPIALIRAPGSFDVHSENVAITVNADLEWSAQRYLTGVAVRSPSTPFGNQG